MIYRIKKLAPRIIQELKTEFQYLDISSRPRKLLFDHLPKCGGSTLSVYLEAHYPKRKTFQTNGQKPTASVDKFKNFRQSKRYGYDLIKSHLSNQLIDYAHPECLKITILREPVDRIVSHYYYAKRIPTHYLYSKIHEFNMSLEDYVTSGLSGELRNWYTTYFSGLTVADAEQNPEKAINSALEVVLNKFDIVGFLDNYSSFIERLRYHARLRYEYQNLKVNVTQGRLSINDIPKSTIRVIEQINHLDIVLYKKIRDAIG